MTEENSSLIAATILDPKFKILYFLLDNMDKNAYYKFAATTIDKKLGPRPKTNPNENSEQNTDTKKPEDDKSSDFTTTLQEIKCYSKYPKMKACNFYEEYGNIFERLNKAANYYLLSPTRSVPVERVFSHASFQVILLR